MTLKSVVEKFLGVRRIVDPVFGELRYQKVGFWEGWIFFRPVNENVEILIDGNEEGPRESQRDLVSQIEKRYPDLVKEAIVRAQQEVKRGKWAANVKAEEFKLEAIDLPKVEIEPNKFSLSYLHLPSGCHCKIDFEAWKATAVLVEC